MVEQTAGWAWTHLRHHGRTQQQPSMEYSRLWRSLRLCSRLRKNYTSNCFDLTLTHYQITARPPRNSDGAADPPPVPLRLNRLPKRCAKATYNADGSSCRERTIADRCKQCPCAGRSLPHVDDITCCRPYRKNTLESAAATRSAEGRRLGGHSCGFARCRQGEADHKQHCWYPAALLCHHADRWCKNCSRASDSNCSRSRCH